MSLCVGDAVPPLHVVLRAPAISFAAEQLHVVIFHGRQTVERLTLRADSLLLHPPASHL